jgi:hypothetical protein
MKLLSRNEVFTQEWSFYPGMKFLPRLEVFTPVVFTQKWSFVPRNEVFTQEWSFVLCEVLCLDVMDCATVWCFLNLGKDYFV